MTAFLARRIAALLGLGRKPAKHGALQLRVRHGRDVAIAQFFVSDADFKQAASEYSGKKADKALIARFYGKTNQPKVGVQGLVQTSFEKLCEEYVIHEFMHLAINMLKKNDEERAVSVAATLCAATIEALRDAGYNVPERR